METLRRVAGSSRYHVRGMTSSVQRSEQLKTAASPTDAIWMVGPVMICEQTRPFEENI